MFSAVSAGEIHAAQILTGAAMALFLLPGAIPGLRRYAGRIQAAVLACYLLGCVALLSYVLLKT